MPQAERERDQERPSARATPQSRRGSSSAPLGDKRSSPGARAPERAECRAYRRQSVPSPFQGPAQPRRSRHSLPPCRPTTSAPACSWAKEAKAASISLSVGRDPRRRRTCTEFAADSPLEEDGFELTVPPERKAFPRALDRFRRPSVTRRQAWPHRATRGRSVAKRGFPFRSWKQRAVKVTKSCRSTVSYCSRVRFSIITFPLSRSAP